VLFGPELENPTEIQSQAGAVSSILGIYLRRSISTSTEADYELDVCVSLFIAGNLHARLALINIGIIHLRKRTIMKTTFQLDMAADDSTEAKREIIRQSLDEIAMDITNGLRHADISYPVYICVPSSGYAIVSMMTPLDPSDQDWCCIGDIIREIISERLDGTELRSNELPCTMVNVPMGAAEITAD
jgi:hypothetical protein